MLAIYANLNANAQKLEDNRKLLEEKLDENKEHTEKLLEENKEKIKENNSGKSRRKIRKE